MGWVSEEEVRINGNCYKNSWRQTTQCAVVQLILPMNILLVTLKHRVVHTNTDTAHVHNACTYILYSFVQAYSEYSLIRPS